MPMIPPKDLRSLIAAQSTPWLAACLYSNRTCHARRGTVSSAIVNAIIRRELLRRGEEQDIRQCARY
jgi:hypothetical protein